MAVLENHHVATTFKMLQEKHLDIFSGLKVVQYKRVRKNMVGAILATDMAEHFKKLGGFKTAV